jgi:hypothetical protein
MNSLENITIKDGYILHHIEVYTKGDYAGYIYCILEDTRKNSDHETLFRIHDPKNGEDYTLVSVDYGWEIDDNTICNEIKRALTEVGKGLNLDFKELEQTQESHKY